MVDSRPATPEVSHGRGGAGNIAPDDTVYGDGEVVRAGPEGSHADGAFSTGRGGAANIGDAGRASISRNDREVVPESAVRASQDNVDYHTGRGGAGNEHIAVADSAETGTAAAAAAAPASTGSVKAPKGLADKLKYKIFGSFGKK